MSTSGPSALKIEKGRNLTIISLPSTRKRDVANVIERDLSGSAELPTGNHLLLDFTNVAFLSSVELGTLITLHKGLVTSGGRLTLFNLGPDVFRVFSTMRLDAYLEICRSPSDTIENPLPPTSP